ncbi:hypothetical protein LCGC14_0837570 [marine sediment metagenome]|uniref:Uncharacterized protein n=1 Tax=marine sediment metagenome TaxID=412755 RepID=A0A0F9PE32_9ZZZZ
MTRRTKHFWLVCSDDNSRPYLVYGGTTEESARQKGLDILGGIDFEVKMYPTPNLAAASSMHKGKRLEETHSLGKASQRLGHDRSLDRMKRRADRKNRGTGGGL